jgi:hypothetical protein
VTIPASDAVVLAIESDKTTKPTESQTPRARRGKLDIKQKFDLTPKDGTP